MNLHKNTTVIIVSPDEKPAAEKICHKIGIFFKCYSIEDTAIIVIEIFTNEAHFSDEMYHLISVEMESIKAVTLKLF
jgi:hypothetical protein